MLSGNQSKPLLVFITATLALLLSACSAEERGQSAAEAANEYVQAPDLKLKV